VNFDIDHLVFAPHDVDLARSPLRGSLDAETFVLGAFNPGLTRLPNGNVLMMVRVAEALREPVIGNKVHAIRWDAQRGYVRDAYDISETNATDPRKFQLLGCHAKVMALTSLSWLLPVELSADGINVVAIHYDGIIAPQKSYQQCGVEDARISKIGDAWFMTTCSVSPERHSTTLYTSRDGRRYAPEGIVLDHQNKDMLYFEGRPGGHYHALTRPLGDLYFAYPPDSPYQPGPSINLAVSPDGRHWRPVDTPLIRPRRDSKSVMRIGGGSPPVLTADGWLTLYHGVEPLTPVGVYRTFWALLDETDPAKVIRLEDEHPLLESKLELTEHIKDQRYLSDIVFTTGMIDHGDTFIVASGEIDLACRITHIPKAVFR
jgi:predicted GH43/DUF377 family glycosyl hydrolase